ncbi:hypothetical protein PMAYCL1PPCAC_32451, partial [Pristionchus mayeri]
SVSYHIYDMEPYKRKLSWIPNNHYSTVASVMRLVVHEILPNDMKEALILDTDMLVLDDISPIVEAFKETNESVLFGMTENMSPWYTNSGSWPARDIFNALTVTYPNIVVQLPCEYNVQLGAITEPWKCLTNDRNVKITHFNSHDKLALRTKYVAHFAKLHLEYQSMDGYALRLRQRCENDTANTTYFTDLPEMDEKNDKLSASKNATYRTHLYFNGFNAANSSDNATLVAQLPADQLAVVNQILKIWKGPVSAAIYCSDADLPSLPMEYFIKYIRFFQNHFPIEYLRNVAIDGTNTKYAYIMDYELFSPRGI